jgi:hypothetical protein
VECKEPQDYRSLASIIYTLTRDEGCDLSVTFSSAIKTILAQHSIDNVIHALQNTPKIANQIC